MLKEKLRSLRERMGVSQQDVATALGVSRQVYNNYELGKREPDFDMAMRLAGYFQCSVDYMIGNSDNAPNAIQVPVLGTITAGIPIEAIEDIIDVEELPMDMRRGGREYFGLKIKGDSMEPEYRDGDVVILMKASTCESGDDCAVMVNGEDATFKRVIRQEKGIVLQPINTAGYVPSFYSYEDVENLPISIIGVFAELRRKRRLRK